MKNLFMPGVIFAISIPAIVAPRGDAFANLATGVGTNVATGGRRGKLPKVSRPKLGQGVVGRSTAG